MECTKPTLSFQLVTIGFLHTPKGYNALLKCLEYCTTDYEHNPFDPHWDNWPFRDVVEQFALSLLIQLVRKFGPKPLLKYQYIDHWLAKEPWGNTALEREDNFLKAVQATNQKLPDLLRPIFRDPVGRIQLEEVGLVSKRSIDRAGPYKCLVEVFPIASFGPFDEDVVQRGDHDSSAEHLRRRHREAMVLNDGSRPLGRADIIQRE